MMSRSPRKLPTTLPMQVDSDLLGSCGLLLESEVYTSGEYSISRVDYRGRKLVAEISPAHGVFQHRWPSVKGLLTPVSARDLPGGKRLLLFEPGNSVFLCEMIQSSGKFPEKKALSLILKVLKIVTDLQSAGMISGYLGPEMFLSEGDDLFLLAGRRGVPASPFTPPEVGGARPSDPRSDVSAVGSLLFRLMAGTDERDEQLAIWKQIRAKIQKSIQDMVAADPVNRPGSLKAVEAIIEELLNDSDRPSDTRAHPVSRSDGFARGESKIPGGKPTRKMWYVAVPVILLLAYLVFRFSGPPSEDAVPETQTPPADTTPADTVVSPWTEQTVTVPADTTEPDSYMLQDTVKIWVSNCSGTPGLENDFRAGPLSDYSYVYPLTGTARRRTSIVVVRRTDPNVPPGSTDLWQAALDLIAADSSFTVKPVDLTIMLGTDLSYAGLNSQFFRTPSEPAGTLYVDVVNHGIQYALEGMGAATWVGHALNGRSCIIDDKEWLVLVSDIRDADRFNEEVGIPASLEETLFLFRPENSPAASLELLIRQYLQALPMHGSFPLDEVPVPDLHVLIGAP